MISRRSAALLGAGILASPGILRAQEAYPNRPIRILVPYAAGGGQDITARLIAEPLRAALGQPVVVENRSGAAGIIGAQALCQAPADGYTLMLGGAGETAINPHMYKERLPYNPGRDMRAVMVMVKVPIVIMGFPGAPFTNVPELVAAARANPGKFSYSSSGIGNPQHLAGELFNRVAGVDTLHVPYRGSGPAVLDIAAGQVQFGYNSLASGLSLIREGRIRAIGVTSRERMAQLPDVGAVAEFAPMANYELVNFFGLFAPTGVPEPIMRRLHGIVLSAMREPTLRARFEEQGLQVQGFSLEESQAFMISESEKLGRIVAEAKITAE